MNAMMQQYGMEPVFYNSDKLQEEMRLWCLIMVGCSVGSFFFSVISKYAFGNVGENITYNIRSALYSSILAKHQGWHDSSENATGVLSDVLAKDVQTLNGVSTEGGAAMAEAAFAMLGGVVIAFIFSWKVALVALAVTPFMIFGAVISAKVDA